MNTATAQFKGHALSGSRADKYRAGVAVFGLRHSDGGDYAPIVRFLNGDERDWATARLIAAAPQLLDERDALKAALVAMMRHSFRGISDKSWVSRACPSADALDMAEAALSLCEKGKE